MSGGDVGVAFGSVGVDVDPFDNAGVTAVPPGRVRFLADFSERRCQGGL